MENQDPATEYVAQKERPGPPKEDNPIRESGVRVVVTEAVRGNIKAISQETGMTMGEVVGAAVSQYQPNKGIDLEHVPEALRGLEWEMARAHENWCEGDDILAAIEIKDTDGNRWTEIHRLVVAMYGEEEDEPYLSLQNTDGTDPGWALEDIELFVRL